MTSQGYRARGIGIALLSGVIASAGLATTASACRDPDRAIGVAREIRVDTRGGPVYGQLSRRPKAPSLLQPKEVVLTFDDGPVPWITGPILAALDAHCTKATFFAVGRMAVAYPDTLRDVVNRGHSVGTHTWSHQILTRLEPARAEREIELGIAAVTRAAGQPIAPFFRFPGLNDSRSLIGHLARRGIATFTVDVVTDDSFTNDAGLLARRTLQRIEARNGGIVLFHDIKPATAKALPAVLAGLKERGYRVVHLVVGSTAPTIAAYEAELTPLVARLTSAKSARRLLLPFVPVAAMSAIKGSDELAGHDGVLHPAAAYAVAPVLDGLAPDALAPDALAPDALAAAASAGATASIVTGSGPDTGAGGVDGARLGPLGDEPSGSFAAWGRVFRAPDQGSAESAHGRPSLETARREDWGPLLRRAVPGPHD